jgi:hypothetical protein
MCYRFRAPAAGKIMHRITLVFRAAAMLLIALSARAESADALHPYLTDKFYLEAGAFFPRIDLTGRVDGSGGEDNPNFDFEDQFGASNDENLGTFDFAWRFYPKWSMHLQHFETGRSGTAVLDRDVQFGDATFEAGSQVSAASDISITRFFVGREFSKKEHVRYGFGGGLHRLGIGMSLSGNIVVNGQPLANETRSAGTTAPLPDIGGWYYWSPAPKWVLGGRLDWLAASSGEYGGSLLDFAAGADYQFSKHFGVGVKYQQFKLDLDVDKTDWHGNVEVSFSGAFVFLSANWN